MCKLNTNMVDGNKQDAINAIGLAAATCIAEMLGGGIVGLPYVVVQTYIIFGGIMIVFGTLLTYYTGYLLSSLYSDIFGCNKHDMLVELLEQEKQKEIEINMEQSTTNANNFESITPYLSIAKHIWPSYGEYICGFSVSITLVFVDVVFLVLCGMNLLSIIGENTIISSQTICIIIFAILTLILSYLWRKVHHYKFFVWLAVLSSFIAIILAFPIVISNSPKPNPPIPPLTNDTIYDFLQAYGTIMFAFGGHAGFPTYQKNMGIKYQHLFKYSIAISYIYIFIMILPFSIVMALLYGDQVDDNILNNLPDNNIVALVIIGFITFHMLSAMATLVPPVAVIISKLIRNDTNVYWWSPILVQLVAVIIAISLQDNFLIIMGILGNTTVTLCTFVMPCLLYVMHFKNKISIWNKICCWICVVVGILTGICAIGVTIYNLINQ
eukprot:385143_1